MSENDTSIMTLNSLTNEGTAQRRKRVGRGMGSGTGKTAGRGHKGQKSRTGGGVRPGFEGGQMPLQMRLPKFGFSSRKNNYLKEVNVKNIDGLDLVTIETLKEKKIISKSVKKVKIFGTFDLTSKINVKGIKVTSGAKESIEKAGGTVDDIVVPTARPKGIKKTEGASE
jgi:large subunit ribosomal protein L15